MNTAPVIELRRLRSQDACPNDRRRTRLAHALKDFGQRVQYSVFECRLKEEQLTGLRARVAALIDPEEDSVRLYRLCAECVPR